MTNESNDPILSNLKEFRELLKTTSPQQDAPQLLMLADRAYNLFRLSADLPLTSLQRELISELASLPKDKPDLASLRVRAEGALDMCLRFATYPSKKDITGPPEKVVSDEQAVSPSNSPSAAPKLPQIEPVSPSNTQHKKSGYQLPDEDDN